MRERERLEALHGEDSAPVRFFDQLLGHLKPADRFLLPARLIKKPGFRSMSRQDFDTAVFELVKARLIYYRFVFVVDEGDPVELSMSRAHEIRDAGEFVDPITGASYDDVDRRLRYRLELGEPMQQILEARVER